MDDAAPRSNGGRAAYYARLLPHGRAFDTQQQTQSEDAETDDAVTRALRKALVPEDVFYRVLKESKLYTIIFSGVVDGDESAVAGGGDGDDSQVVVVQEITKHGARTSARERGHAVQDRNAFCVKKMPEEVVASSGRLQCLFGAQNAATWFIQLKHVENAYMILSIKDQVVETLPPRGITSSFRNLTAAAADPSAAGGTVSKETIFLEKVKAIPSVEEEEAGVPDADRPDAQAFEATGRFYYRVLVPIELRKAPDLLAPVISRHVFKNAEEIIECSRLYRCPQSSVMFVKLAYEDGWLFETLNSGIKVLERLANEPAIEYGQFFYVVKIPVGIRVAPNIMALRAGKGYKLHSIVEASQRFTPPGSKITHHQQQNGSITDGAGGDVDSSDAGGRDSMQPGDDDDSFPTYTSCHGGWIFERTMDGQVVLEPIVKPALRQVERLFYRVLDDVDIIPIPSFALLQRSGSSRSFGKGSQARINGGASPPSPSSKRKRLKGTLIECSERLVPTLPAPATDGSSAAPEIAFVKLRHDVGWICERQTQAPYHLVLEQVQGFAVTRDLPKFYRVLVPVHLRSAPDFECPRLPGVAPMAVGSVFESCLQYTPPGSTITYVKVASESLQNPSTGNGNGWLFDRTPSGDQILEAVDEDPEKKNGKFFYRVLCEKKEVLLSPERNSEVVKFLFANTIFAAEMEYTLPRTQETYVRLAKEKGWVLLDPISVQKNPEYTNKRTLFRISEDLYNLYCMPPSWVSVGHPNRTWFKVPDETCRTILAEETMLQIQIFEQRNVLATSSQGRDNVALSRQGVLTLENGEVQWKFTLEEIKHSASALLFTFPWKQVWWIFEVNGLEDKHCVELQHGLRGGFRSVIFDGEVLHQNRSVSDILWDAGSEFSFTWQNHTFKVLISLEGAFFSQYLQFYSYTLLVDEEEIVPVEF
ncbi:hypothetical protein FI667_g14887, partial [Globisporangium splendens]